MVKAAPVVKAVVRISALNDDAERSVTFIETASSSPSISETKPIRQHEKLSFDGHIEVAYLGVAEKGDWQSTTKHDEVGSYTLFPSALDEQTVKERRLLESDLVSKNEEV